MGNCQSEEYREYEVVAVVLNWRGAYLRLRHKKKLASILIPNKDDWNMYRIKPFMRINCEGTVMVPTNLAVTFENLMMKNGSSLSEQITELMGSDGPVTVVNENMFFEAMQTDTYITAEAVSEIKYEVSPGHLPLVSGVDMRARNLPNYVAEASYQN